MKTPSSSSATPHAGAAHLLWFLLVPAVLLIGALFTEKAHEKSSRQLERSTQSLAKETVGVLYATRGEPVSSITLPGVTQAYSESPVYARVNGYVRTWYADIGARVHKGDLLAEIDAPDVDQQLSQARAQLSQTDANLELAKITASRYQDLIQTKSVSQQEVDQNNQNLAAQQATQQAAAANVGRLEQTQGFEKVFAPFDGVITERKTDFGDLINAGNDGTGRELFRVSQISTIRVFVNVPEEYSQQIAPGSGVSMDLISLTGKKFPGRVTRTSNAIDSTSRMLLVEVDVANLSGQLLPGAYANIHFQIPRGVVPLVLPNSSILFQAAGPQVAIVDSQDRIQLRKVSLGRDFGDTVEIIAGVTSKDAVVANPPDSITTGTLVAIASGK
jgi:RND family efflux transporter MFP subunit